MKHSHTMPSQRILAASPQPDGSDAPPLPAYQPISERPLTAEEIAHFEALARELHR
jgi:hypothetical protein